MCSTITIIWREIPIEARFQAQYLGLYDHLEVRRLDENGERSGLPLPITDTGYRSIFVEPGTIICAECPGGLHTIEDFVIHTLDAAIVTPAARKIWHASEDAARQLPLI